MAVPESLKIGSNINFDKLIFLCWSTYSTYVKLV